MPSSGLAWPRLLDEWQVAPALWNQVRRAVDAVEAPGQFLLTGSAVPADDAERHTGAGRFSFLRLRPMGLVESGAGQGGVSLAALLEGEPPSCADPGLAVTDLAELVCRGAWPAQLERPQAAACRAARDYLEQVRQVDVRLFGSRPRDLSTVFAKEDSFAFGEESWDFIFSRPLRRH